MAKKPIKSMEELLAGIPDTGFTKGEESNNAAEYVATHPETWTPVVLTSPGRPKRGQETGSITKSVRFPEDAWALIKQKAMRLNLSPHAAMRKALLDWAQAPDVVAPPPPVVALVSTVAISIPATESLMQSDTPSYVGFLPRDPALRR